MVETLSTLLFECIQRHAPLRRVRVTRPPALGMQSLRAEAHSTNTAEFWNAFRQVRNQIKSEISKSKWHFVTKSLSCRHPKAVWRVIYRILNPGYKRNQADPNRLNHFFATSERTTGNKPDLFQNTLLHTLSTYAKLPYKKLNKT